MRKVTEVASNVLDTLKYLGLQGAVVEDVKRLATLAQQYEDLSECWRVTQEPQFRQCRGGVGSPVLYNVPDGYENTLTINVGALILALHAISDKQIHRSAVKFDWEEKRNS